MIDRFISITIKPTSTILLRFVYFLLWHSHYGVVLCCYLLRLPFLNHIQVLSCEISLEMSIQLFFFQFLLSSYFYSVDAFVFCFVFGCWNQSPSAFTGCPRGVMGKAMDCGVVVSEFEFQSRHYVHFRTNTLGKGMNPLIPPAIG